MPPAPLPTNEAERLEALRSYDVADEDGQTVLDNLADLAAELTRTPVAVVSLLDERRVSCISAYGSCRHEVSREHAMCGYTIQSRVQPLVVPDARLDARFADNPFVTTPTGIRFYAGAALINTDGIALGALAVIAYEPRFMDETQRRILLSLAESVMTRLELGRAMRQVRRLTMALQCIGAAHATDH